MELVVVGILFAPIAYWAYRLNKRIHFLQWDIRNFPEIPITGTLEFIGLCLAFIAWGLFSFFMMMPASVALRVIL
jgi:hypothetical protein